MSRSEFQLPSLGFQARPSFTLTRHRTAMRMHTVVEFNQNWVGSEGFLSNFPFEQPLDHFGIQSPFNVGMGAYAAKRNFNGRRADDTVILRFKIEEGHGPYLSRITQELPHKRVAVIEPMEIAIHLGTLDDLKQTVELWRPFRSTADGHPMEWRRIAQQRLVYMPPAPDAVPGNLEGVIGDAVFALIDRGESWFSDEFSDDLTFENQLNKFWGELWGDNNPHGVGTPFLRAMYRPAPADMVYIFEEVRTYLRSVECPDSFVVDDRVMNSTKLREGVDPEQVKREMARLARQVIEISRRAVAINLAEFCAHETVTRGQLTAVQCPDIDGAQSDQDILKVAPSV